MHEGQRFPAPYLTVMDWGHDERDRAAGHPDRAPRLSGEAWAGMVANIRAVAARSRGGSLADLKEIRDHLASIGF